MLSRSRPGELLAVDDVSSQQDNEGHEVDVDGAKEVARRGRLPQAASRWCLERAQDRYVNDGQIRAGGGADAGAHRIKVSVDARPRASSSPSARGANSGFWLAG